MAQAGRQAHRWLELQQRRWCVQLLLPRTHRVTSFCACRRFWRLAFAFSSISSSSSSGIRAQARLGSSARTVASERPASACLREEALLSTFTARHCTLRACLLLVNARVRASCIFAADG